jgi:hypothetical protein
MDSHVWQLDNFCVFIVLSNPVGIPADNHLLHHAQPGDRKRGRRDPYVYDYPCGKVDIGNAPCQYNHERRLFEQWRLH